MGGTRCCAYAKGCRRKLNAVKAELQRRMHEPIPEVGKVVASDGAWTHLILRSAPELQRAVDLSVPSGAFGLFIERGGC